MLCSKNQILARERISTSYLSQKCEKGVARVYKTLESLLFDGLPPNPMTCAYARKDGNSKLSASNQCLPWKDLPKRSAHTPTYFSPRGHEE